jgi:hypothetical protein
MQFMKKVNQTPKPVGNLFSKTTSRLHTIYQQACRLDDLQKTLMEILPVTMRPHVRICNYQGDSLHLFVDTAHWATRLRYMELELITNLRALSSFQHLKSVRYSIRPVYTPPSYHKSARAISKESANHIATVAKYIEDEPLRKALIKLSHAIPPVGK